MALSQDSCEEEEERSAASALSRHQVVQFTTGLVCQPQKTICPLQRNRIIKELSPIIKFPFYSIFFPGIVLPVFYTPAYTIDFLHRTGCKLHCTQPPHIIYISV